MIAVDPLEDPSWDEAVLDHSEASVFHSSAWFKVLARTYGHRPACFRLCRDGRTQAMVPLMEVRSRFTGCRGICMPFADACGPLSFPGADPEFLRDCLGGLARERGWNRLELRTEDAPGARGELHDATFIGHRMALAGGRAELEAGFSSAARRALRKARRAGVKVRVSDSPEALESFCRLHLRTRRRHGAPVQPAAFFRHVQGELLARGLGFVVIAELGGRDVAAAVFLHFGANGLYKFGASDERVWGPRPNNLVMAEGIFTLAERGVGRLHFGRTNPDQEGLRRFKRQWGASEHAISYQNLDTESGRWGSRPGRSSGRDGWLHVAVRGLPPVLNRALGRIVYPHLD